MCEVHVVGSWAAREVLSEVLDERLRQVRLGYDHEHDDQHTASWWSEQLRDRAAQVKLLSPAKRREQLVQIAALAVAAVEREDRLT